MILDKNLIWNKNCPKLYEDGTSEIKVAYEVSIASLEVVDEIGHTSQEEEVEENKEAI